MPHGVATWRCRCVVPTRRGAHMPGTGGSNGDASQAAPAKQLSCTPFVDQLYFCYSPVWQLQELYRQGHLDDCKAKWSQLFECASLRAKPDAEARVRNMSPPTNNCDPARVAALTGTRTQARLTAQHTSPSMWRARTVDEASAFWRTEFPRLVAGD